MSIQVSYMIAWRPIGSSEDWRIDDPEERYATASYAEHAVAQARKEYPQCQYTVVTTIIHY